MSAQRCRSPRSVLHVSSRGRRCGRRAVRVALLIAALLGYTNGEAAAQEPEPTRAAENEAARRAKAEALAEAPPPNKVERAFGFIETSRLFSRIFNPPRGWFAQVGGVG